MKNRDAFTLIEMLLATVLASILMGGVLSISAGLSRDRLRMSENNLLPQAQTAADLIARDLRNSMAIVVGDDITLIGHAGLDEKSLNHTGRLCRVVYSLNDGVLVRQQMHLDDPVRPNVWSGIVATGVKSWSILPLGDGTTVRLSEDLAERAGIKPAALPIPARARIRIGWMGGALDRGVTLR